MDRKSFHILLKRYLEGSCSAVEQRMVDQWYELLENETPASFSEEELKEVENRLWEKIQQSSTGRNTGTAIIRHTKIFWKRLGIAAAVACLIGGAWWYHLTDKTTPSLVSHKVEEGMLEEVNVGSATRQIYLEDGSCVRMEPNAKIAFPQHFLKSKREVYLEGEAFFEVTKNPGRPFFVYNNNLVAEVLGTSFNIKIIKNKIEVAVRTGRVAVFENGQQINLNSQQKLQNGVIVTPNQKVTYYPESRYFVTSLVETPVPVLAGKDSSILNKSFVFDETPLTEVLSALEKSYQIEIVLENDNLGKCPFTGDITRQTLYNKLEVVCSVFQASYEIKGTRILIKGGKGCN
ncbi:MAG TPA: FecR domain-containing protein [Puia sp.]